MIHGGDMKVVINSDYGGFGLSVEALALYADKKGKSVDDVYEFEMARDDPDLVEIVERLGLKANGNFAQLKIVEIPDGVSWYVSEYDGLEHIAERHRTWS